MEYKILQPTMYNRNYGGFELRPNPLGIANVSAKPKIFANLPVTDGYTKPLAVIKKNARAYQIRFSVNKDESNSII